MKDPLGILVAQLVSKIPRNDHVFMEIIGWIAAACFLIFVAVAIIKDVRRARRDRKLAAEVLINPQAAYHQILKQEKLIAEFDVNEAKRQTERRQKMVEELVKFQEDFIKNFPWADGNTQSALREQLEHESPANR